jgi:ATP-dependent Lhr-like helicase
VRGRIDKQLVIDTLIPREPGRFSWGGHLGAQMQQPVVDEIAASGVTLVFTNVRSQAEIWYQLLLQARPDWAGLVALHHGSLDKGVREWVEAGLKAGTLKAVVATSSLDLGVDFLPVERVLQIGSAKGVARLLQRAGRSGHAPGRPAASRWCPPTRWNWWKPAAARRAALAGQVESRHSPQQPLDVLVQHLVTVALGGDRRRPRLRRRHAVRRGAHGARLCHADARRVRLGAALLRTRRRQPDGLPRVPPHRAVSTAAGAWCDRGIGRRHKLQIGTIVSDATMKVAWVSGGTLGTIEESFIARLSKGDCFVFAGRLLEYVRTTR